MIRTLGTIAGEFIQVDVAQSGVSVTLDKNTIITATRVTVLLALPTMIDALAPTIRTHMRTRTHVSRMLPQMGVEDIASTHRRSVEAIRADIANAPK